MRRNTVCVYTDSLEVRRSTRRGPLPQQTPGIRRGPAFAYGPGAALRRNTGVYFDNLEVRRSTRHGPLPQQTPGIRRGPAFAYGPGAALRRNTGVYFDNLANQSRLETRYTRIDWCLGRLFGTPCISGCMGCTEVILWSSCNLAAPAWRTSWNKEAFVWLTEQKHNKKNYSQALKAYA